MQPLVFDAVHLLGFGPASTVPLPAAAPGETIIRVGDWSLIDLSCNALVIRRKLMHDLELLNENPSFNAAVDKKLTAGIYRLRYPLFGSREKSFSKRRALLEPGEEIATAAFVATVLIVHIIESASTFLEDKCFRCSDDSIDDCFVTIVMDDHCLLIGGGCESDPEDGNEYLMAAQKIS